MSPSGGGGGGGMTCNGRWNSATQGGDGCHGYLLRAVLGGAGMSGGDHVGFEQGALQVHMVVRHGLVDAGQHLENKQQF